MKVLIKIASQVLEIRDPFKTWVWKTRSASAKMPHRSQVFKTRVLCKKNFPYSSVFKPYSDVLKPYSGVFL